MDMTQAKSPRLNKIWWDKNKAKTLTKTGVGDSLLDFEMALDKALKGGPGEESAVQLKAKGAKNRVDAAIKKADKSRHKETITALTGMFAMLDDEIKKSVARSKAAPAAAAVVATPGAGKPVTIYSISVAKEVGKKYNAAWVNKLDGWDIALTLDAGTCDVLEKEDGGLVFAQQMQVKAKEIGDGAVDAVVKYLQTVDKGGRNATAQQIDGARKDLQTFAQKQVEQAARKIELVPEQIFDDFKKANKQYLKYRVKAGVKITQGTASVALSAAALVGSHGASAALSIVGIVRGTADIVKTLYDLALEADTVGKQLATDVAQLQKDYYDAAGKVNTARQQATEITGSVIKTVLGTDCPFLVTLPKVTANYQLWGNKVAGVYIEGTKLSGRVTKTLEASEKLEKKLQAANEKTAKKVYEDLLKIRAELDRVLTKTNAVMSQAERYRTEGPKLQEQIKAMNNDNSKLAQIIEVVGPLVANIGLSAAGAGMDFKAAESALDFTKTAITFANDISAIGQSALEAAIGD